MGSLRNYLVIAATVLLVGLLVKPSEALVKVDITAAISGQVDTLNQMAGNTVTELENFAALQTSVRPGPIGEAIQILTNGCVQTIRLLAKAGGDAFKLIDKVLGEEIRDKQAARNAIHNGIIDVRQGVFHSGAAIHNALGAAMAISSYANKGGIKVLIDEIQETGSVLFEELEAVQYFAIQAINADNKQVMDKCRKAARSAMVSALVISNANILAGGKKFLEYLATVDGASLKQIDPIKGVLYGLAKAASEGNSGIIAAINQLNAGLVGMMVNGGGIGSLVLSQLNNGLTQYLLSAAHSTSVLLNAFAQVKQLADNDPQAASEAIKQASRSAESILIDGSVQAYIGIGAAEQLSGLINQFQPYIKIVEKTRLDGTKTFSFVRKIVIFGIKSGGSALDQSLESARICLDALQAIVINKVSDIKDLALKNLKLSGSLGFEIALL